MKQLKIYIKSVTNFQASWQYDIPFVLLSSWKGGSFSGCHLVFLIMVILNPHTKNFILFTSRLFTFRDQEITLTQIHRPRSIELPGPHMAPIKERAMRILWGSGSQCQFKVFPTSSQYRLPKYSYQSSWPWVSLGKPWNGHHHVQQLCCCRALPPQDPAYLWVLNWLCSRHCKGLCLFTETIPLTLWLFTLAFFWGY